jgi:hypothetical protein
MPGECRARAPAHLSPLGAPRAVTSWRLLPRAADPPHAGPLRPRTTDAAPGRRSADLEIRVASAGELPASAAIITAVPTVALMCRTLCFTAGPDSVPDGASGNHAREYRSTAARAGPCTTCRARCTRRGSHRWHPRARETLPSKREPNVISCFVSTQRYGLSAGAAVLLSKTRASTPQESASRTDWRCLRRCFASPVPLLREGSVRCEMHDVYKDDDLIAQVHGSVALGMEIPTCTTSAWHSPPGKQTLQSLVCDTGVLRQPCPETSQQKVGRCIAVSTPSAVGTACPRCGLRHRLTPAGRQVRIRGAPSRPGSPAWSMAMRI